MARMNQTHRTEIREAALKDIYIPIRDDLERRRAELFDRIYNAAVSDDERKAMAGIDPAWLCMSQHFQVNAGGYVLSFMLKKAYPSKWNSRAYDRINITDEGLIQEARDMQTEDEGLTTQYRRAYDSLFNLLDSARTFEALAKSWPEGEEYWKPVWEREKGQSLPAIQVSEVNRVLGLPKPAVIEQVEDAL